MAGLVLSLALAVDSWGNPTPLPSGSAAVRGSERTGLPTRLRIPRIKVHAPIEHVGLTPDGAMDVPKESPMNAAWYDLGPRPGDAGSSVIDGHFGTTDGSPAVFDDLRQLRTGDRIQVEDASGAKVTFMVRGFRTYQPEEDATSVFSSSDGRAHLNLITCTGVWNRTEQRYSNRLVVFTDRDLRFGLTRLSVVRNDDAPGYDVAWIGY
ncbi:MAG TPA: class F sortase [Patescibacteria group bacterium]|jgi:LPXTG-site transpeptidase (sortase) family protein